MDSFNIKLSGILIIIALTCVNLSGQDRNAPDTVAGIPVNYDLSRLGEYTLPDLLITEKGDKVETAQHWMDLRRDEILTLFRENQFGYTPDIPEDLYFEVFDKGTPALNGKAIRKQVSISLNGRKDGPVMDLVVYLPNNISRPVPILLYLSFIANYTLIDDSGIRQGEVWNREHKKIPAPAESPWGAMNIEKFLDQGIGFASVYYGDIEPDFLEGIRYGIRSHYLGAGKKETLPNQWGAISAWAWGLSRAMDYFETDVDVDQEHVALLGASRLGKTVLWAGSNDSRFAVIIASCSGEGGAALSRRNYGETIAHLTAPSRYPYQFCKNYAKYGNNICEFPVDAHMLISLIAPRPLLLQTGDTDYWSDPEGEFVSAVEASSVYRLFNKEALNYPMPPAGKVINHTLGYYMHSGGHGFIPSDFDVFINYLKIHFNIE